MPSSARILDGKAVSATLRDRLTERVNALTARGLSARLDVLLVGDSPASQVYVANKQKACAQVGIESRVHQLPADVDQQTVLALIDQLAADDQVSGILVQLPLPDHLDPVQCVNRVPPHKDIDGFHALNIGRFVMGEAAYAPCTPLGIMTLLTECNIPVTGQQAVVIGVGNVGRPLAHMLTQARATVTLCHSRTADLAQVVRRADLVCAAIGKPMFITADMIQPGATVIDVGIHRKPEGGLCGDVDFEGVSQVAGAITPVPGGVGPMTVTMLLFNTVAAAEGAPPAPGSPA